MSNILYGEWLKLKRSKIIRIGLLGSLIVPVFVMFNTLQNYFQNPDTVIDFFSLYDSAIMFLMLLFAPLVMSIFAVWLISREYSEKTLKTIFSVPVSRKEFLTGKFLILYILTLLFMVISWFHIFVLAVVCKPFANVEPVFSVFTAIFLIKILIRMLYGGTLLYMTLTPVIYLTLRNKGFLTPLISAAVVCLFNVVLSGSGIAGFFPWTASYILVSGRRYNGSCPPSVSIAIIILLCALSFALSMKRFLKEDIP
ncbi:MAG: ABC transporter permease [Alistipes sp.]|nr:ABC transporter permease [Alistipes sp.]